MGYHAHMFGVGHKKKHGHMDGKHHKGIGHHHRGHGHPHHHHRGWNKKNQIGSGNGKKVTKWMKKFFQKFRWNDVTLPDDKGTGDPCIGMLTTDECTALISGTESTLKDGIGEKIVEVTTVVATDREG